MANRHSEPLPGAPISQDGKINPAKIDVATKAKRRRKARNRPEPAPELRKWSVAAEARMFKRPYPPNIILEPAGFDEEHWTSPHSDADLWTLQIADAFGTRSHSVLATFMGQLEALCGVTHWDDEAKQWRLDENHFSATLALVNRVKPRNEMEAALAAQMVAVHLMTMKVSARALKYDYETRTASVAGKLARTFAQQLEALQRLRGGRKTTRQLIKVTKELHQHVHYHRGEDENERQPHGPSAGAANKCTALPGPQPGGEVVPLPSRARKAGV